MRYADIKYFHKTYETQNKLIVCKGGIILYVYMNQDDCSDFLLDKK